eukprot:TRINITY_DN14360_c0_g1_i1.p3 TRINITY_DN14360_c0_g1~~TRINITY_DN14360_c0_g1_i1.p3  ORF type:complete len:583 (-),score=250.56 TRINITY_DN14360_c0_g1_i1:288-2036(-)
MLELAGRGERPRPRRARIWLSAWAAARPEALSRVLAALPAASAQAREAAGQWLFEPELEDELPLRRALLSHLDGLMALAARLPEPWLLEGLAELMASRGGAPLRRLLAAARQERWACQVVELLPASTRLPGGSGPRGWRVRRALGPAGVARLRRLARAGRWSQLAREDRDDLALARSMIGDSPAALQARPLAWPAGLHALPVLADAVRLIAAEGRAAYEVAQHLSLCLGRVVILMGNASLGGPPLWAAPGPWQQEAGAALGTGPLAAPPRREGAALARLRAARLGGTGLLSALWKARTACLLAGRGMRAYKSLAEQAASWLSAEQQESLANGSLGLSLTGPPWQQALDCVRQALERCLALERQARAALGLVYGLAARGAAPLVLPWADKFAASTAKGGDHLYLARLAALLARLDPPPLLLLIDETVHPGFPSLVLVLAEAGRTEPGLVFRGVGAFAGEPEPRDLAAAALQAARGANLVALRPAPGEHPEGSLAQAAQGKAGDLPLTPASRDSAACLLAGTGLKGLDDPFAPLGRKEPPAWLLTGSGFAPLGSWVRRRVAAIAGRVPPRGRRWQAYARACGLD